MQKSSFGRHDDLHGSDRRPSLPGSRIEMCGIAGYFGRNAETKGLVTAKRMALKIRHRGPDDEGVFIDSDGQLVLCHQRLSIIDLSEASHQPMRDVASGVVLAFNGEIYNFLDLREQLSRLGHRFQSVGDTEVLLRAYIEWGIDCVKHLCGMFAFVIWDPRTQVVHLARDATGMKPLYYLQGSGWVAFGSEIKAFCAIEEFQARLDPMAVRQFLEFGYVFESHRTSFAGVNKLEPGERVELADGKVHSSRMWYHPPCPDPGDQRGEQDRIDELAGAFRAVVREHLIADVPVGLLLSGGLDSSLIASIAARHGQVTTVTMGFDKSDVDERPAAQHVAAHIGSRHIDVLVSAADIRREIETGAWVFDDLFADWGTVSSRLLYRRCRELGIKVVLVGEGADELFGGYSVFRQPERLSLWAKFKLYQTYSGRRHGRLFGQFRKILREYLSSANGDAFHAVRLFESRRQLPNNYVMKVDKASMAESVEARAPFLDRRIAEIAWRTPRQWLMRDGENKDLLRAFARRDELLPKQTPGQAKFGAPLAVSWMDDDPGFRSFARDRILSKRSQTNALGLGDAMSAYFDHGQRGYRWPFEIAHFRNLAWRLLLLELWSQEYLGADA